MATDTAPGTRSDVQRACPVCGVKAGEECLAVEDGQPALDSKGRRVVIAPHAARHKPRSAPQTRIKTNRGVITVDSSSGRIDGLWRLCQRELRTAAQVRKLAGGVARDTLLRWRAADFPEPVLKFPARAGELELFSRTEVEAWLAARRR